MSVGQCWIPKKDWSAGTSRGGRISRNVHPPGETSMSACEKTMCMDVQRGTSVRRALPGGFGARAT